MTDAKMETVNCRWCGTPFERKVTNNPNLQEYCTTQHRHAFHKAKVEYITDMVDQGFVTVQTIRDYAQNKAGSPQTTTGTRLEPMEAAE